METPISGLTQPGADQNAELHLAVSQACMHSVQALLDSGCDPNSLTPESESPLHTALRVMASCPAPSMLVAIIECLLKANAKPNSRNLKLQTPMHLARQFEVECQGDDPRLAAFAEATAVLIAYGARPELVRHRLPHEW